MPCGIRLKDARETAAAVSGILFAYLTPMFGRLRSRWGATDEELARSFSGDALVPQPKWTATRAVTVHARAEEIWPWLVQMGQGRGGFYSYEVLENLMGLNIQNATRVIPEFQDLKVGDEIRLSPTAPPVIVALLDPARALVLRGGTEVAAAESRRVLAEKSGKYVNLTWGLYLAPMDDGSTRLIVRTRSDYSPHLSNWLFYGSFSGPMDFVMERKMLLEIKRLSEAAAGTEKAGRVGLANKNAPLR
ncbi:hypothetical protein ACFLQ0_05595 [Nitrospinota bacterium]